MKLETINSVLEAFDEGLNGYEMADLPTKLKCQENEEVMDKLLQHNPTYIFAPFMRQYLDKFIPKSLKYIEKKPYPIYVKKHFYKTLKNIEI